MTFISQTTDIQTTDKDYYAILGVSRNATEEEIEAQYKILAAKYRRERSGGPDAESQFVNVTKAYKVLRNARIRSIYDRLGSEAEDVIDEFEDLESSEQMSTCDKILWILLCVVTCCGCGGGCCCFCFCCCCCKCCCGKCCR
ncbi:unnamed protein product [Rotaria socialis]|uniref:J domain-containing protein n=1 Tax=Rotaria socialis TaxID=392032 RepID=A0A817QMY8_9BILA|nr:unnamed protein product [Rotaria socialis]